LDAGKLNGHGWARLVPGALAAYGAVGLQTALAFVSFGVVRAVPQPAPVTIGARILLIPACDPRPLRHAHGNHVGNGTIGCVASTPRT
jgi:hypothetical protein